MAVARKIKTLLTVNILVFVGIILFSVYCRIQDRSEELVQIGRMSDQRLRARNGKVSNLVDRQSILQRLERLEDVVYNQLNGKGGVVHFKEVRIVIIIVGHFMGGEAKRTVLAQCWARQQLGKTRRLQ